MDDDAYLQLCRNGHISTYMQDKRRQQKIRRIRIAAAVLLTLAVVVAVAWVLP